jgi:predicted transcriptional regulator
MNTTVDDIMVRSVVVTMPHKSVGHVREIMRDNKIQSVPVVDSDHHVLGIATANDLLANLNDGTPISKVMTENVLIVPKYEKVHIAARMMRNHHVHHLVVTHEKQAVGVLSAFDLLKLVEEHRYEAKNPPSKSKKSTSRK